MKHHRTRTAVTSFLSIVVSLGAASSAHANADLEKLLTTGSCEGCDLQGIDLQNQVVTINSLQGSKLSGANLAGIELRAELIGDNDFSDANLRGAKIWANGINGNRFVRTNLSEAYLGTSSGHGRRWSFSGNTVESSNLTKARIETDMCFTSHFKNSDLSGFSMVAYEFIRYCTVTNSKADGSSWNGRFINQSYSNTSLVGATFVQENQSYIYFSSCDLRNAVLRHEGNPINIFDGSNLSGATIRGVLCAEGSLGVCNPPS